MLFKKDNALQCIEWIRDQLGNAADVHFQELHSEYKTAKMLYIQSICDEQKIQEELIRSFFEFSRRNEWMEVLVTLPQWKHYENKQQALQEVVLGSVLIQLDSYLFLFQYGKIDNKSGAEATVETVIQGPKEPLSESTASNIGLIRHRYPQPSLRLEETKIGRLSQTKVTVLYDENLAVHEVVQNVKESLNRVKVEVLQAAGQLEQELRGRKRTLFPVMMITERPDRIAYNLGQGKVVILIEGTPFALIAPTVFYDFMSSMEDLYQSYWVSRYIVTLRYLGLAICLLMPSLYVGVTAYNPELFRVQLALSIAGSRVGVPYPAFMEVLFMLLMMELLTEASIRLPKSIGSTATTVGGLILGQAAAEASLVSNVMIIVVAAVAISNFVIPINAMTFAMRFVKYILLVITTFLGMVGLVIGVVGLIAYMTSLDSFGQPYLKLYMGGKKEAKSS